jgi:hypothetical protein
MGCCDGTGDARFWEVVKDSGSVIEVICNRSWTKRDWSGCGRAHLEGSLSSAPISPGDDPPTRTHRSDADHQNAQADHIAPMIRRPVDR